MSSSLPGKQRVLEILQKGGWWSTPALSDAAELQHNTTVKWVFFLRKELAGTGFEIIDRPVQGKRYNEYKLIKHDSHDDKLDQLIADVKEYLKTCPMRDHTEYRKAELQLEQLLARRRIAA